MLFCVSVGGFLQQRSISPSPSSLRKLKCIILITGFLACDVCFIRLVAAMPCIPAVTGLVSALLFLTASSDADARLPDSLCPKKTDG